MGYSWEEEQTKKATMYPPSKDPVDFKLQKIDSNPHPLMKEVDLPAGDPVNHPKHYTEGGIETLDFIEAKNLGYHVGNCVKYLSRAGKKNPDPLEDLRKAAFYLNREIERLS